MAADPHPELTEAVTVTRFWNLVSKGDRPDECWIWQGDKDKGYGVFFYHGRMIGAHELALSFTTGEKRLESLETCHACDNPPCVNPGHLRFGTRQDNVDDMVSRGRNSGSSTLTEDQVVEIRNRRANGARQKDLAADYGITDGQVSMIVRGIRWPEAGGPIQTERKYIKSPVGVK